MDIQSSVFQSNAAINQYSSNPSEQRSVQSGASLQSQKEEQFGLHSTALIQNLTQDLVDQSSNSEKVAAIKERIAAGTFEVDAKKIADNFLWGERITAMSGE